MHNPRPYDVANKQCPAQGRNKGTTLDASDQNNARAPLRNRFCNMDSIISSIPSETEVPGAPFITHTVQWRVCLFGTSMIYVVPVA